MVQCGHSAVFLKTKHQCYREALSIRIRTCGYKVLTTFEIIVCGAHTTASGMKLPEDEHRLTMALICSSDI